jgi:Copper type II ascorbate-dependent monooxygenase, C-terminal domain
MPHQSIDRPRLARLSWMAAVAGALALGGCGSGGGTPGTPDAGSGSGTPDAGGDPNAITLTMTSFNVPAGGEVYKCENFANPFGGEVEVSGFESHMSPGSHHMLLFYIDTNADKPLEDCSGLEFHPTPYGAQTPDSVVDYPAGIAALIPAGQGLRIQAHYLNATDHDLTATVKMTFHLADPGSVTAHAGMVFMNNLNIYVQPSADPQTVTGTCSVPRDVHLIYANSHMHKHGIGFQATDMNSGTMLYQTDNWSDPPLDALDPAIDLSAGDQIQWSCTYNNDTGGVLTFGESAATNEMCIFTGQYYPAPETGDPMIGCGVGG